MEAAGGPEATGGGRRLLEARRLREDGGRPAPGGPRGTGGRLGWPGKGKGGGFNFYFIFIFNSTFGGWSLYRNFSLSLCQLGACGELPSGINVQ